MHAGLHARAVLATCSTYITEYGHGHCTHTQTSSCILRDQRGWMQVSGGTTDCSETRWSSISYSYIYEYT